MSRDTDSYLASAASGKRFVVFSDGAPKAAIIGIDDLRRFEAMRRGSDAPAPDDIDTAGVDYRSLLRAHDPTVTPIGVYADGTVATLSVRRHHAIIASEHSGREDLLTSAILGAAIANPPTQLNFVLATGRSATGLPAQLANLPHVVAEETDLDDKAALARFLDHIRGEVQSRRALLQRHRVRSYAELRSAQPQSREPTELVFVIDGATELLDTDYELRALRDLVTHIAVAEDTYGLYLWLSSPTPLPHGLRDVVPSRVALQVLSGSHSRDAIGVSDAAQLTRRGSGYVKAGNVAIPRHFQVVAPFDLDQVIADIAPEWNHDDKLSTTAEPAERLRWAAELPQKLTITELVSQWETEGGVRHWARVPIGVIDNSAQHRHSVLTLDFANNPGIVMIAGGNPDHVTAAVATMIAAAHDTNAPEILQFIYLGPAYHTAAFPELLLPNVSEIISWDSSERIDATIEALTRRIATGAPGPRHLVLVVDGWQAWRRDRRDRFDDIADIARRGHPAGVHLVIGTNSYDFHLSSLTPFVSETIELRLSETYGSPFERAASKLIPDDPRRGLTKHGQILLATS
ncbi:FtsK/SpoIIIE domain-containing protein [Mycobacterium kyorinense]|uniref:FtsK domain-containing protein n=1 Tax=Mycobacterium kyorinense TaxID=487514 RepID=A0A1X1XFN2_9MYCO|nr:FtsK/SpoIIIE domain-containing protein [Mycobacterium kyorinense]ORV97510.1 hypothetical protein AWC14_15075 [Mycobacterium kyorinense]